MLKINGQKPLSGTLNLSGSKNAALPLIALGCMFERSVIDNVPRIADVFSLLSIIESLGAKVEFQDHTVIIERNTFSLHNLDVANIKKIRVGLLLIPALYQTLGSLTLPTPGGCAIGSRHINDHIHGFQDLWLEVELDNDASHVSVSGEFFVGERSLSAWFWVTPTENILMMSALRPGVTHIRFAAIEPHVINLVEALQSVGFDIEVLFDHTIKIVGNPDLFSSHLQATVQNDPIEAGTYMIIAALMSEEYIDIRWVQISHLGMFLNTFRSTGARYDMIDDTTMRVYRSRELAPVKFQTNIFPGFPTDLQSPFSILLTQAQGDSRIHEVMFESRLGWLAELESLKWKATVLNPHQAIIHGPTQLVWGNVASWDLRAGVAMIIAGLIARGTTHVTNIRYIDRGYEDIIGKLQAIGADIERIDED